MPFVPQQMPFIPQQPAPNPPQAGSSQSSRQNDIVDTRILSKPKPWTGDRQDWKRFAFQLSAYMQALSPELPGMMKVAEKVGTQLEHVNMTADKVHLDMKFHTILCMLVEGQALQDIMNCPDGHGLEAWRCFTDRQEPGEDRRAPEGDAHENIAADAHRRLRVQGRPVGAHGA